MRIKFEAESINNDKQTRFVLDCVRRALSRVDIAPDSVVKTTSQQQSYLSRLGEHMAFGFAVTKLDTIQGLSVTLGYRAFTFYHKYTLLLAEAYDSREDNTLRDFIKSCLLRSLAVILSSDSLSRKHDVFQRFASTFFYNLSLDKDPSERAVHFTALSYPLLRPPVQQAAHDLGYMHGRHSDLLRQIPDTEPGYSDAPELLVTTESAYLLSGMLCRHLMALLPNVLEPKLDCPRPDYALHRILRVGIEASTKTHHTGRLYNESLPLALAKVVELIRRKAPTHSRIQPLEQDIHTFIGLAEMLIAIELLLKPAAHCLHLLENPSQGTVRLQGAINYTAFAEQAAALAQQAMRLMQKVNLDTKADDPTAMALLASVNRRRIHPITLDDLNRENNRRRALEAACKPGFESIQNLMSQLMHLTTKPSAVKPSAAINGGSSRPDDISELSWCALIQHGWLAQLFGVTLVEREYLGLQGAELNALQLQALIESSKRGLRPGKHTEAVYHAITESAEASIEVVVAMAAARRSPATLKKNVEVVEAIIAFADYSEMLQKFLAHLANRCIWMLPHFARLVKNDVDMRALRDAIILSWTPNKDRGEEDRPQAVLDWAKTQNKAVWIFCYNLLVSDSRDQLKYAVEQDLHQWYLEQHIPELVACNAKKHSLSAVNNVSTNIVQFIVGEPPAVTAGAAAPNARPLTTAKPSPK